MMDAPTSQDPGSREDRGYATAFAALFVLVLLWRLAFLWIAPLDLSPDEAYYWDWSRHLDWGYYSKPPMVAWIIALSTRLVGSTTFGVRLPAAILATLTLAVLYALGTRLHSRRAGFWAAATGAAMPGANVTAMVMTIDAPLFFFWALSLYAFWRAAEDKAHGALWWLAAGLASGLGLLSKQTMIAFWPAAFLFLLVSPERRHLLRRPWPYLAPILCLLCLAPVVWWNMRHGWVTVEHTAHHFHGTDDTIALSLTTFGEFLGSQMAVLSPVTFLLIVVVGACSAVRWKRVPSGALALAALSVLPLAGVTLLSLRQGINANWPAPFYLAAIVLVAVWAEGGWTCPGWLERLRGLYRPGVVLGAALAAFLYAVPWLTPLLGLDGGHLDLTARIRGWQALGRDVNEVRATLPDPQRVILIGERRQIVSELAFYVPGQPEVYRWHAASRPVNAQYDLWPGPSPATGGWNAIIVIKDGDEISPGLAECFEEITPLKRLVVSLGGKGDRVFHLYFGRYLRGWTGHGA